MPLRKSKAVNEKLEIVVVRLLDEMIEFGPDSEDYPTYLDHLDKLNKLRQTTDRPQLNPNQMALVAGNLFGILIIVAYEHSHAMTSKALNFVPKAQ